MPITQPPILSATHLTKSFGSIKALDNVDFDLQKGEVHALMGENGAGKSTFMKLLIGLLKPDAGEIFFEGIKIDNQTVQEIRELGISMIHQEILVVPELTVAQNIFLGRETKGTFWLNEKEINQKSAQILQNLGLEIKPQIKIKELSIAEKQMVEIAKAISNNAKVIIMDEPTSALSEKEATTLFKIIGELKNNGVSIIYISHKLDEIFEISDRITVLRDGKYIDTKPTADFDKNSLVKMMVGREIENLYPINESSRGEKILSVENLSKKGKFSDINFEVFAGEVLGIAGLIGAGRTEIARAIFGLDQFDNGTIMLKNKNFKPKSPQEAIKNGVGYVSEDRKSLGFIPELSINSNLSLGNLPNYAKGWFIQTDLEMKSTTKMAADLNIKSINSQNSASKNQKVKNLSGGNQQKVVIGKVLLASPSLIILDEPTRGIDIGAKFEIYKLINQLINNGIAIIMISSELSELIGMSDRVLVISKGKQTAILSKKEATQENIMHYALH